MFIIIAVNVIMISLLVIAICQIKQAWFPIIYTPYESEQSGVEISKDSEEIDESNPMFQMIMDAYERSKTMQQPSQFVQRIIDNDGDTGVEIITDKDEMEG